MMHSFQRNFLFIWICVLLGIALALSLTFAGCAKEDIPMEGKATSILNDEQTEKPDEQNPCIDSDGGIEIEVNGTVTTADGKTAKDECVSAFLIEYYCEDGDIRNKNVRCFCRGGECIGE